MFTATVFPGYQFAPDEKVDTAKLNQGFQPTIQVTGNLSAASDFTAVTPTTKTFTTFDLALDILRVLAGHGANSGQRVKVSSATTLPAGLSATYEYYLRPDVTNPTTDFTLHHTAAGAAANTDRVDVSSAGTGTHTLTFYSYATGKPLVLDAIGNTWKVGLVSQESLPEYQGNTTSEPGVRGAVPPAPPTADAFYYLTPRGAWSQFPTPSEVGNDLYLNDNVY